MRRALVPVALTLSACASTSPIAPATAPSSSARASAFADASAPPSASAAAPASSSASVSTSTWALVTQSPWPAPGALDAPAHDSSAREVALAHACGGEDGALTRVARDLVAIRARGLGAPDAESVIARLRASGEPYVRPRIVFATGRAPLDDAKLRAELARRPGMRGHVRCGVAIVPLPHGGEALLALRVEALADLAPLPTRARTGEWLTFEARLHVGARSAKLVVLGPRGAPRTLPTSLDPATGQARARFALDQPGAFTLQLVADVDEGPRPLLEARVFADMDPTPLGDEPAAPGEDAGTDASALARMVAALRSLEGFPPLAHDDKLDALARAHAERMRDQRLVGHDVGDGDFRQRFEAEGTLDARAVGENVAHAPTVALAHRALHNSPSHRINLLRADYTHIGVGVAHAADGSVYVCETFAATARPVGRASR